jgi:hypothetical protein
LANAALAQKKLKTPVVGDQRSGSRLSTEVGSLFLNVWRMRSEIRHAMQKHAHVDNSRLSSQVQSRLRTIPLVCFSLPGVLTL